MQHAKISLIFVSICLVIIVTKYVSISNNRIPYLYTNENHGKGDVKNVLYALETSKRTCELLKQHLENECKFESKRSAC